VLVVLASAAISACATFEKREPMTLEQVVQMSKDGAHPADVINRIKDSRTVFMLTGSQYAKLREDGVDDSVLDYIQRSYVASVEMDSYVRYRTMYWGYGWGSPYYYPYYGPRYYHRYRR
jgi:hypothetical protein